MGEGSFNGEVLGRQATAQKAVMHSMTYGDGAVLSKPTTAHAVPQ